MPTHASQSRRAASNLHSPARSFLKEQAYEKIKLLGEGSFGKAYLVSRQSDGMLCV